jgi:hypothetical protein
MLRKSRERFKELCEHAEVVEDTNKLRKIAKEIDRILTDELDRLENRALPCRPRPESTFLHLDVCAAW